MASKAIRIYESLPAKVGASEALSKRMKPDDEGMSENPAYLNADRPLTPPTFLATQSYWRDEDAEPWVMAGEAWQALETLYCTHAPGEHEQLAARHGMEASASGHLPRSLVAPILRSHDRPDYHQPPPSMQASAGRSATCPDVLQGLLHMFELHRTYFYLLAPHFIAASLPLPVAPSSSANPAPSGSASSAGAVAVTSTAPSSTAAGDNAHGHHDEPRHTMWPSELPGRPRMSGQAGWHLGGVGESYGEGVSPYATMLHAHLPVHDRPDGSSRTSFRSAAAPSASSAGAAGIDSWSATADGAVY